MLPSGLFTSEAEPLAATTEHGYKINWTSSTPYEVPLCHLCLAQRYPDPPFREMLYTHTCKAHTPHD